jgi:hypothetical protein
MFKAKQKNTGGHLAQKNASVHLEAFNLTARELIHAKKSDKISEELSRVVSALSEVKSPEVWNLSDSQVSSVILNSAQLIHQLDSKQPVVWNLIDLLTQVANLSDAQAMARDFQLLPVLSRQLHECIDSKSSKTWKLLELIQLLVQGFSVLSIESYLIALAQNLEILILGQDHKLQLLAASILSTLLR